MRTEKRRELSDDSLLDRRVMANQNRIKFITIGILYIYYRIIDDKWVPVMTVIVNELQSNVIMHSLLGIGN